MVLTNSPVLVPNGSWHTQPYRLMVSTHVIHAITWITTHLPIPRRDERLSCLILEHGVDGFLQVAEYK